ncbi:hypothetical protein GOBAR_AA01702 [Gossypium barbadense]|uniref:Uncharacterized protein n=1 Tax=Gossypium barbadense TaxID=3634 RepID=A0A2P5YTD6_GOSBA|nr:hypothetical protein GOBAR_AA01702 [Gossypium barbadense]
MSVFAKKATFYAIEVRKEVEVDTKSLSSILGGIEDKELGLKIEEDSGRIKMVNSKNIPITSVAKGVELKLGEWTNKATIKLD